MESSQKVVKPESSSSRYYVVGAVILTFLVGIGIGIAIGYSAFSAEENAPDGGVPDDTISNTTLSDNSTAGEGPSDSSSARRGPSDSSSDGRDPSDSSSAGKGPSGSSSVGGGDQKECKSEEDKVEPAIVCEPHLPRNYIVTRKSGALSIDGKLDDEAWNNVPWIEDFVDIRGLPPLFPAPDKKTQIKLIYDDSHIFIAARLTEDHVWATYVKKDSRVYEENAFQVFFDVDNSMTWYKEFEINALGTTWDLALSRAYVDGGDLREWNGISEKGVYTDGTVNNIDNPSTFWSMEVSFAFTSLNEDTARTHETPLDGEVWLCNFARPQYQTKANYMTGKYEKVPGSEPTWWSWNPIGAINLYLPNKWGLLYFANQTAKEAQASQLKFKYPDWKVFYALFYTFDAMKSFKATHGMYVSDQKLIQFNSFIVNCYTKIEITLTNVGFEIQLAATSNPDRVGHIDQQRRVWFTT